METLAEGMLDPNIAPDKRKKHLVISSILTLLLKAHSAAPIIIPSSVEIKTVNDALWSHILTKGLIFSANFFAVVTFFLLLSYIFPRIYQVLRMTIKQQYQWMIEVLEEHPELTEKKDFDKTFELLQIRGKDLQRNFTQLFQNEIEENNMVPFHYYCALPFRVICYIGYLLFDRLPVKFPFILASFTVIVASENITSFFSVLL